LTDVGQDRRRRTVDQVDFAAFPSYAVRHPRHVCWLNHTMREYYDLWPAFRAQLSSLNQQKEGIRRRMIHPRRPLPTWDGNVRRLFVQSQTFDAGSSNGPKSTPTFSIHHRRSGPIASTTTSHTSSPSPDSLA
jgi:hypothetical protein